MPSPDPAPAPPPGPVPDADAVFARFFDRWYRPTERERRGTAATRPDLLPVAAFRGRPAGELSPLTAEMQARVQDQIARMVAAARTDWGGALAPHDVLSREGLLALDRGFDEAWLRDLLATSDPADFGNSLLVTACELGAVLGEALRGARRSLQWVPDWPYWESVLVDARTGHVVPPFHWAIKRLSAYGLEHGLVEKIAAALELIAEAEPHR